MPERPDERRYDAAAVPAVPARQRPGAGEVPDRRAGPDAGRDRDGDRAGRRGRVQRYAAHVEEAVPGFARCRTACTRSRPAGATRWSAKRRSPAGRSRSRAAPWRCSWRDRPQFGWRPSVRRTIVVAGLAGLLALALTSPAHTAGTQHRFVAKVGVQGSALVVEDRSALNEARGHFVASGISAVNGGTALHACARGQPSDGPARRVRQRQRPEPQDLRRPLDHGRLLQRGHD